MKVLFVCSGNFDKSFEVSQVFVSELIDSLKEIGVDGNLFFINRKGFWGYFSSMINLWIRLFKVKYDLIHAFYGLSGLIACLQIKTPVVVSFLGSDINDKKARIFSKLAFKLSNYSVFVERSMSLKIKATKAFTIIPFGIDTGVFISNDKSEARKKLGYSENEFLILFSSSYNRQEKNYLLASEAIKLTGLNIQMIELGKSYPRKEMSLLYDAVDIFLMTSLNEGSPQTIKEAMACNCPIVTTNVGDVKWVLGNTEGCFITSFGPEDVAEKIKKALEFGQKTNGRGRIIELGLDTRNVANKILEVYLKVIKAKN